MTQRDSLPCGVLFVGAGPASLCGAIRLVDCINEHNAKIDKGLAKGEKIDLDAKPIMVIEKAAEAGMHQLSGAIIDPRAIKELIPDFLTRSNPMPVETPALHDQLVFLFGKPLPIIGTSHFKAPITPPTFDNHGNYIASLYKVTKWLADVAREKGVQVLEGFPA